MKTLYTFQQEDFHMLLLYTSIFVMTLLIQGCNNTKQNDLAHESSLSMTEIKPLSVVDTSYVVKVTGYLKGEKVFYGDHAKAKKGEVYLLAIKSNFDFMLIASDPSSKFSQRITKDTVHWKKRSLRLGSKEMISGLPRYVTLEIYSNETKFPIRDPIIQ